jgi:hypothetical protein
VHTVVPSINFTTWSVSRRLQPAQLIDTAVGYGVAS